MGLQGHTRGTPKSCPGWQAGGAGTTAIGSVRGGDPGRGSRLDSRGSGRYSHS